MRLAGRITLPDDDPFETIVADHAAPQRIVQVEDQTAAALPAKGGDEPANMVDIERKKNAGERQLRKVPLEQRMPFGKADRFGERRHIEQQVLGPCDAGNYAAIDGVDQMAEGARHREIETAEIGLRRPDDCLNQTNRLAVPLDSLANRREGIEHLRYRALCRRQR